MMSQLPEDGPARSRERGRPHHRGGKPRRLLGFVTVTAAWVAAIGTVAGTESVLYGSTACVLALWVTYWRSVASDYADRLDRMRAERDAMEERWLREADRAWALHYTLKVMHEENDPTIRRILTEDAERRTTPRGTRIDNHRRNQVRAHDRAMGNHSERNPDERRSGDPSDG